MQAHASVTSIPPRLGLGTDRALAVLTLTLSLDTNTRNIYDIKLIVVPGQEINAISTTYFGTRKHPASSWHSGVLYLFYPLARRYK